MPASKPVSQSPTRRSDSRSPSRTDARRVVRAIARSPTGKPLHLKRSQHWTQLSTSQNKTAEDSPNMISDPPILSPSPISPRTVPESFAAGYPLKRSPRFQKLSDLRSSELRNGLHGGSRSISPLRTPKVQSYYRRSSDSALSSREEAARDSLIPRSPRFQQYLNSKSSLSPQLQQECFGLSSPLSDSSADGKRRLPATGIASPEGSQRTYLTSSRRERARSQRSADDSLGMSSPTTLPKAQSSVAPPAGTPSRSPRLSSLFEAPSLPPPSRPAPTPPSESLHMPTTHLPPTPPTESLPIPPRSSSRLALQHLKPLVIPPLNSDQSVIKIPAPHKQYSLLSTIKPGIPCALGFVPLSPSNQSVHFSAPPSPPQSASSPSSVKSPTSSSSSSHSFTSIDEQVNAIFSSPTTIYKARQVTMSKPSIAVRESASSDTEALELRQANRREFLAKIRRNSNQDKETVINLESNISEDMFVPDTAMPAKAEGEEVEKRITQNTGRRCNLPNEKVTQRATADRSTGPKIAPSGQSVIPRKSAEAIDNLNADVQVKKLQLQRKINVEEKRKLALVAQLQGIKNEVKEMNKRKKEKESEIDQIAKRIKGTADIIDQLEESRDPLNRLKRLLQ